MPKYASQTTVPANQSRSEIERTITKYGASEFVYGWTGSEALVQFQLLNRRIRFKVTVPKFEDFRHTSTYRVRTKVSQTQAFEQATRQVWRALLLIVKAKLEAVDAGISTFEEEFLAHIVLPSGDTVGGWIIPQVERAYETGEMPEMLPMLGSGNAG
jgi:hypothetical protein